MRRIILSFGRNTSESMLYLNEWRLDCDLVVIAFDKIHTDIVIKITFSFGDIFIPPHIYICIFLYFPLIFLINFSSP